VRAAACCSGAGAASRCALRRELQGRSISSGPRDDPESIGLAYQAASQKVFRKAAAPSYVLVNNDLLQEAYPVPIINSKVPEFKAQVFHQGAFKTVTNDDLKGKWSVFFFYPADFTFVCPTELGDLADNYAKFKELKTEIYGISTDTHFTHKAWHDTSDTIKKVQYPLLADPTGHLARAFGVYIEEEGLAYRGTFLINPEGMIKLAEINDNGIGRNAEELLRKVTAAQYTAAHPNEVCPAKWTPGAATLKPGLDLVGKI
jgi:peroxiredoxin